MIIGVSGKINSGKDTIGSIIQYLTLYNDLGYSHPISANDMDNWIKRSQQVPSNWEIRKFAGKLKECVSLITGISLEDLEKQDVKNSLLGEDWIRYGYADGFIRKYVGDGKMSDPIMNNVQCSKEKYEYEYRVNWQTAYKHEYSVRDILQLLGTEVGRAIHNDFWVNALFVDYDVPYNWSKVNDEHPEPNWIITDLRFPNELEAVKKRNGITIRVNRDDFERVSIGEEVIKLPIHSSETALDDATFDYTIDNNGTIDELIIKVRLILKSLNIIK